MDANFSMPFSESVIGSEMDKEAIDFFTVKILQA